MSLYPTSAELKSVEEKIKALEDKNVFLHVEKINWLKNYMENKKNGQSVNNTTKVTKTNNEKERVRHIKDILERKREELDQRIEDLWVDIVKMY